MQPEFSPFRPGQPADLDLFVGRSTQIARVRQMINIAGNNRFQIAFLTGERGIGKTSLAAFVRYLVERDEAAATSHVMLGGVDSLDTFVRSTLEHIIKDNAGKPWYKNVIDIFGRHVESVGLFGVSVRLRFTTDEMREVTGSFPEALRRIQAIAAQDRPSLFIVLDDIDFLAGIPAFANWLKSVVDAIAIDRNPFNVAILLVGLEETRRQMISLQPSLARVFDVIDIRPWDSVESEEFFRSYFASVSGEISSDGLRQMTGMAGGLPVVAHEIGDAVYRATSEYPVSDLDAIHGILIAAESIGNKMLKPQIIEALHSERYREILRMLPEKPLEDSFRRSELIERLPPDSAKSVDAFLRRMRDLGAIVQVAEHGRGVYRFINPAHYLYFWQQSYSARNGSSQGA